MQYTGRCVERLSPAGFSGPHCLTLVNNLKAVDTEGGRRKKITSVTHSQCHGDTTGAELAPLRPEVSYASEFPA